MKNIIFSAAVVISLILFLRISVLSGDQKQSGLCFSYLNGEIMFDYDPDSNFLYHYKKLTKFTTVQKTSRLRRLKEVEINADLSDIQIPKGLSDVSLTEMSIKHLNFNTSNCNPPNISGLLNEKSRVESKSRLKKTGQIKRSSSSFITTPCGICNNFPIILVDEKEMVKHSSYESIPIEQSFTTEGLVYCNPTPEPQTICLFGSALISLGLFNRFRKKKKN